MKDLCLVAYSDQFRLPQTALDFILAIRDWSEKLGVVPAHLDYIYADSLNDEPQAERRFGMDEINQLQLPLKERPISELSLWTAHDEQSDKSYYDLFASLVDDRLVNGYEYAYIQCPLERIGDPTSIGAYTLVSNLLLSLAGIGPLDYALITIMEDSALPTAYFHDIFTSGLTQDQALDLATWKRKAPERKTRLRGLYWGNWVSAGHLARISDRDLFMNRLRALLGSQRLRAINHDTLFFMLPSPDLASNSLAASVKALLEEQDLLMHPDDESRQIVSGIMTL